MRELKHYPLTDHAHLTGTTVVYRELDGRPEYVIVCGECDDVKFVGLEDAMRVALQEYLKWHHQERHGSPSAQQGKRTDIAPDQMSDIRTSLT